MRTDEYTPCTRLPCCLVRKKPLVRLETRKPDGHLGYNPREDSSETLIQRQWCFPLDDVDTSKRGGEHVFGGGEGVVGGGTEDEALPNEVVALGIEVRGDVDAGEGQVQGCVTSKKIAVADRGRRVEIFVFLS